MAFGGRRRRRRRALEGGGAGRDGHWRRSAQSVSAVELVEAVEAHDARGLRFRGGGDGLAALRERGHGCARAVVVEVSCAIQNSLQARRGARDAA